MDLETLTQADCNILEKIRRLVEKYLHMLVMGDLDSWFLKESLHMHCLT